jgi:hypothetical protein
MLLGSALEECLRSNGAILDIDMYYMRKSKLLVSSFSLMLKVMLVALKIKADVKNINLPSFAPSKYSLPSE